MNSKRFRNFTVVIYEDDPDYDKQAFYLSQEGETIYIRHDQDLDDEGNDKKPHYHYVLRRKDACTISALSKRIEVKENMIEPVKKSMNGCLRYLVHFGYDDKFQYNPEDVKGNSDKLIQRFLKLVTENIPEGDKVETIEKYILEYPPGQYIEWPTLGAYARKYNLWDIFRRNSWYFTKLVDSHNSRVSAMRYHISQDFYD